MTKKKPQIVTGMRPDVASANDAAWKIAFAVLTLLLLALIWFPLAKLPAHYEMGPNEGFNSYFQAAAASGAKVYGSPPEFWYANYPPLSFHIVGWIGKITGDTNI